MKQLLKFSLIIIAVAIGTFILQAQVKPPEREFVFKVPERLIQSYAAMIDGRVDEVPVGQYKELTRLFNEQAYAQQKVFRFQDSSAAAKLKPPAPKDTTKKN